MMSWRPEKDWDAHKIASGVLNKWTGMPASANLMEEALVEAGADAMLEVLKAEGRYQTLVEIGIGITAANCPWSGRGWLFFIPEEER